MRRVLLGLLLCSHVALADDLDALALADLSVADEVTATAQRWQLQWQQDAPGPASASLQLQAEQVLAPALRGVLADRLALNGARDNALQEAYLGWQPQADWALDLGRINQRSGVALDFNPTDFFRDAGQRGPLSAAPARARGQRLGVVMLRGQHWWQGGAMTLLYAPQLGDGPTTAPWSPDVGRSNRYQRWQWLYSRQLAAGVTPQWSLSGQAGQAPLAGVSLSVLAGNAWTLYGAASGGRQPSLLDQATQTAASAWHSQWQLGGSFSSSRKLTLTVEYQYQGRAVADSQWRTQGRASAAYLQLAAQQQLSPTRRGLFVYLNWQDVLLPSSEFNAMLRHDVLDHSQLRWLEWRYHFRRADLALAGQQSRGDAGSHYRTMMPGNRWQWSVTTFF